MSSRFDIAIVGAGIAGAGLAAEIDSGARVLLIEAEDRPGYHSTGRSAAFWSETYGGPLIQPLTSASHPFLADFLSPRGALHLAKASAGEVLDKLQSQLGGDVLLEPVEGAALRKMVPGLRQEWDRGLLERSCADIDVASLHADCLKRAARNNVVLVTGARLVAANRSGGYWRLDTKAGSFEAGILANAAGAWADDVAALAGVPAIGIQPYRRTMVQLRIDPAADPAMPLVIDALGRFYFKPEAGGRLWLSPHDEIASPACDCAAEEYDVALAIERLHEATDWRVEAVEHRWAGLRSFSRDRLPVYGFAAGRRDFFWCAGQGGFGIQTAPAASMLAAVLITGEAAASAIVGIDPSPYLADRFG